MLYDGREGIEDQKNVRAKRGIYKEQKNEGMWVFPWPHSALRGGLQPLDKIANSESLDA